MKRLYRCFRDKDALMAEINPLAAVENAELIALDAKMSFDGNALYRRPDIADLRDFDEEDPKEVEASGQGLVLNQGETDEDEVQRQQHLDDAPGLRH